MTSSWPRRVLTVRKRGAPGGGTAGRSAALGSSHTPPPAAQAASTAACMGALMRHPTCPSASSAEYTCRSDSVAFN